MQHRRADNAPSRQPTPLRERFYHENGFHHLGDSFEGINHAKARGFKWIDTNHTTVEDGTPVCMHPGRPMMHGWRDPEGKMRRTKRVKDMTLEEFLRLRPKKGQPHHVPHTSAAILTHCAKVGIGVEFELKNGRFTAAAMRELDDHAHKVGVKVKAKTISTLGGTKAAIRRLRLAHRWTRWETVILPRGTKRVPRSAWPFIDHVRGKARWTGPEAKA